MRFNSNIINSGKYLTMRKQTCKQIIDRFSLVYTGQILKINISNIRSVLKDMDYG